MSSNMQSLWTPSRWSYRLLWGAFVVNCLVLAGVAVQLSQMDYFISRDKYGPAIDPGVRYKTGAYVPSVVDWLALQANAGDGTYADFPPHVLFQVFARPDAKDSVVIFCRYPSGVPVQEIRKRIERAQETVRACAKGIKYDRDIRFEVDSAPE